MQDYGARFYDPQIGRFHTVDRFSERYFSLSTYQYAKNNPILFVDINGDSAFVDQSIYNNTQLLCGLINFMNTKQGYKFMSQYAAKGQNILGYTFDKDGKYSKSGVNLTYNAKDMGDGGGWGVTKGSTSSEINDGGNLDITVTMNTNSAALSQDNDGNILNTFNAKVYNSTGTYFHESFIHGDYGTNDFLDNHRMDYSNISAETKAATTYPAHYQHYQVLLNDARNGANNTGLWPGAAYQGLSQVNQTLKLNYTEENIKYIMWNYNGGK